MENFSDKDIKDFADKLFDVVNKTTAGHMVESKNIDINKEQSFYNWIKKLRKK